MKVIPASLETPCQEATWTAVGHSHWGGITPRQDQGTPEVPSCTEHPRQEDEEKGAAEGASHQNTSSHAAQHLLLLVSLGETITPGMMLGARTDRRWDAKPTNIYCPLAQLQPRRRGRVPYILFLSLPFLAGPARRPKAMSRSSCTRCRPRARSRFRPPLCRKRCLAAFLRCFRICCLFLSSERTLPCAGGCPGPVPAGDRAVLRARLRGTVQGSAACFGYSPCPRLCFPLNCSLLRGPSSSSSRSSTLYFCFHFS